MSKFKQAVSMKCSQDEYHKDFGNYLEELGYVPVESASNEYTYIMTGWYSTHNHYSFNDGTGSQSERRYFIDHYNPELFKAIAGMREGDEVHVGEWMMTLRDSETGNYDYTRGELFRIESYETVDSHQRGTPGHFYSGWNRQVFRKATLEELVQHFTQKPEAVQPEPTKVWTLEDLRAGKVAIKMDGASPDQLNTLIRYFIPLAPHYFGTVEYGRICGDGWCASQSTDLPTQSLVIFLDQMLQQTRKIEPEFKFGQKVVCWDNGFARDEVRFIMLNPHSGAFIAADENEFDSLNSGNFGKVVSYDHCSPIK